MFDRVLLPTAKALPMAFLKDPNTRANAFVQCGKDQLANNEEYDINDVTLIVGKEETEFRCIKALLAIHSSVFRCTYFAYCTYKFNSCTTL